MLRILSLGYCEGFESFNFDLSMITVPSSEKTTPTMPEEACAGTACEENEGIIDKLVDKMTSILPWKSTHEEPQPHDTPSSSHENRAREMKKSASSQSGLRGSNPMASIEKVFEVVSLPWSSDSKGITLLKRKKSGEETEHGSGLSISSAKHRSRSPSPTRQEPRQRSHTMDTHHAVQKHSKGIHISHHHHRPNVVRKHVSEHDFVPKANSPALSEGRSSAAEYQHKKKVQNLRDKYHMDTPEMQRAKLLGKTYGLSGAHDSQSYGLSNSHDMLGAHDSHTDVSSRQNIAKSHGNLDELRQRLSERGEKVSEIDERTDHMKHAASDWSNNMSKIADKYKKKKWYEL